MKRKWLFHLIIPVVLLTFVCACSGETAWPVSSDEILATDPNASLLIYQFKDSRIIAPDGTEYEFFAPSAAIVFTGERIKIGYIEGDEPVYNENEWVSWLDIYVAASDANKTIIMNAGLIVNGELFTGK
jgi:hypothetical protein